MSFMVANPEPALKGRQTIVPCGNCVGGGSSVNCKAYLSCSPCALVLTIGDSHDVHPCFSV